MSMSLSLTRFTLWPNSVTSSSAVSWSIVWVSVTGMPILNRALTRSAPRSAMRLASSWTVIASGTTTSRTCLVAGPVSWWWRFSFSRARRSAASERARFSSSSDKARLTVSLPRWRCSSRPRLGGAAGFILSLDARLLGRVLFGLTVVLGAAAFVLGLLDLDSILAAARLLQRGQAGFLGFAQQLGLELLAAQHLVLRGRLARRRRDWALRLGRGRGRFGGRLGSFGRRSFAWTAED